MASIDIITVAGLAYKKTWDERVYLLPMVVIPLLIKYLCLTLADIFVEDNNILRMSLIMIPAYFVEGWLLAHWARTIMLDHRWPFKPSGDDSQDLKKISERARGILSGSVSFLLINILMAGYFAFFMSYIPMDINPEEADPSVAFAGAIMMVSTLLLFRFIWFYIPLAVNIAPASLIEKVKPLRITFQMIGIWLVCFIPSIMVLQFIGGALNGTIEEGGSNQIIDSLITCLHVILDTVKNLICTAGMAYAFMALLKKTKS